MAAVVHVVPVPEALPDFVKILMKAATGAPVYIALCLLVNIADCRSLAKTLLGKINRTPDADPEPDAVEPVT